MIGLLPFAGCGEKRSSQPVGFCLAGSADSRPCVSRFIGAQTHRKDFSTGVFLRKSRASHFLSHSKRLYEYKKCLTGIYFAFTKRQVSNETALSSEEMAGTAAGESELTNSLPVSAGASQRESEMNTETFQAGTSARQSRSLKVEGVGDFARRKVIPRIRIAGQWLEQAGFKPGHRVEIFIAQPGNLTLRFVEQVKEAVL